jgi:hypothetical protein
VHGKRLPATENYRLIPYICSGIALRIQLNVGFPSYLLYEAAGHPIYIQEVEGWYPVSLPC